MSKPQQHTTPCRECPWRRTALPGWLGPCTAEEWTQYAHGETIMDCHMAKRELQCAGAAVFRANVAKQTRTNEALKLPPDTTTVFASDAEFLAYHNIGKPNA